MTTPEPQDPASRSQIVVKAALLIVVVGATGVGLLTERQRRFEAAHAMTIAHRRADELEREIRTLRAEIADRLTPARIDARFDARFDAMVDRGEHLRPILWSLRLAQEPME